MGAAVEQGLLTEDEITAALIQLTKTKFRLGFFDPEDEDPFGDIGPEVVSSDKHVAIALEAAQKSMVLVKNNGVLPLKKDIRSLFVTGPMAGNVDVLLGNYHGISGNTVNILDGLAAAISVGSTIEYKYGQLPFRKNENPMDWATGNAATKDATIAVLGISSLWEGEEGASIASYNKGDNTDCKLPQAQIDFLKKLRSKGKKPLVVVITGGSPVMIPEIVELADAVIYAFYPGEQGGTALADIIFGDVSPSGRMPFTVPYSVDDLPPYEDYAMEGRTYRYMTKEPLFPFGFGLSYSRFEYAPNETTVKNDKVLVSFNLSNTGKNTAEEVCQLYIASPLAGNGHPLYSLRSIQRIELSPGEKQKVIFELDKEAFMQVNDEGEKFLPKGDYKIYVGGAVPSERSEVLGAPRPVEILIDWKTIKKI
jgi:beta-glucosidase